MMKIIFAFIAIFSSTALIAQDETVWKPASKESEAYHQYRTKSTTPPYGLAKVKALVAKIEADDEDNESLKPAAYNPLSLREKFTYHMIQAESFSQNCDPTMPIQEEQKKIFAYVADAFEEYRWSERQLTFFKTNRDSVMAWMKESIMRTKRVGVNFKEAIIVISAKEMIPLLIATYNVSKKDLDILTVLMHLMKDNKYEPFLTSPSYKKLYSDDSQYMSYLAFNQANQDLIIKRATDFYNATKK